MAGRFRRYAVWLQCALCMEFSRGVRLPDSLDSRYGFDELNLHHPASREAGLVETKASWSVKKLGKNSPEVVIKLVTRVASGGVQVMPIERNVPVKQAMGKVREKANVMADFPMYLKFYFDIGQEFCQNTGFCKEESEREKLIREQRVKSLKQAQRAEMERELARFKVQSKARRSEVATFEEEFKNHPKSPLEIKEEALIEQIGGVAPQRPRVLHVKANVHRGGGSSNSSEDRRRAEAARAAAAAGGGYNMDVHNNDAAAREQLRKIQEANWQTWLSPYSELHRLSDADAAMKQVGKYYTESQKKKSGLVPVPSIVYIHAFLEDVKFAFKFLEKKSPEEKKESKKNKKKTKEANKDKTVEIHKRVTNDMSNEDIYQGWVTYIKESRNIEEDIKLCNKKGSEIRPEMFSEPKFKKKYIKVPSGKKITPYMYYAIKDGEEVPSDSDEESGSNATDSDATSSEIAEAKKAEAKKAAAGAAGAAEAEGVTGAGGEQQTEDENKGGINKMAVIIGTVIFILLVAMLIYCLTKKDDEDKVLPPPRAPENYDEWDRWQDPGQPAPDSGFGLPPAAVAAAAVANAYDGQQDQYYEQQPEAIGMMPTQGYQDPSMMGQYAQPVAYVQPSAYAQPAAYVQPGVQQQPVAATPLMYQQGIQEQPVTYDETPVIDLGYDGGGLQQPESGANW